jgi:hypothetical protein
VRKDYLRRILSRMVRNSQHPTTHIGENLKVNFLTSPAPEYAGKELMD